MAQNARNGPKIISKHKSFFPAKMAKNLEKIRKFCEEKILKKMKCPNLRNNLRSRMDNSKRFDVGFVKCYYLCSVNIPMSP